MAEITAVEHADDDGETTAVLEQATQDIDRALPPEFRGAIDDHFIAEKRMDAIDAQREAGVRPPNPAQGGRGTGKGGSPLKTSEGSAAGTEREGQ